MPFVPAAREYNPARRNAQSNAPSPRMKPTTPSAKIPPPREYTERAGARVAQPSGWASCPLCGDEAGDGELLRIDEYRTAQSGLLAVWLATHHGVFDPGAMMHRPCLERAERAMQAAQLRRERGLLYFVDLTLGTTPILPTSLRLNADLRFSGRGVTMAFVDSGFYPHDDFLLPENRVLALYDAVRDREVRSIGRLARPNPPVQAWHGTMAAATAAGSGYNSAGNYHGIASEARLVLIRAMTDRYRIRTPQVVRALRWIRDNRLRYDIRVVNMSLGVDETAESTAHPVVALVEELSAAGVVIVAASGNNPTNPIKPPGAAPSAITVGGYNDHNSMEWMRREMWHSSYGNMLGGGRKPELLAPSIWVAAPILPHTGVKAQADALFALAAASDDALMRMLPTTAATANIAEAFPDASDPLYARSVVLARIAAEKLITTEYKHVDGTSFSAPIVSSVVAQMIEARPSITSAMVKAILCTTADLLPGVDAAVQGYGVLNPARALEATLELPDAEELEPHMRTSSR